MPDEYYRTGMGILVAIGVVFAVGLLIHGLVFRSLFRWAEQVLLDIPFVRSVYGALRDLFGLFADHEETSMQVVSVTLPGEMRLASIQPVAMSREDAMKFILTAGLKAASQQGGGRRRRFAAARAPGRTRPS